MQSLITRILPITLILLSLTIGCGPDSEFKNPCVGSWISRCAANTEILIIGPYRTECPSFSGNDCYLEFNEEAQRWHFFYDGIKGFDYEPGFIWTLKVSLHEYSTEWADASSHEYRLVEVLSKEAASVDERPPRIP
jgi:hypothetical protein